MSSILYVSGEAAVAFLAGSTLKADEVSPARPPSDGQEGRPGGFRVAVSAAGPRDFDGQAADALRFLGDHRGELARLAQLPGVRLHLFFVSGKRAENLVAWHCNFPAELIRLAAEFGMSLSVKCDPQNLHLTYGTSPEEG
jgi:hypothetical protein